MNFCLTSASTCVNAAYTRYRSQYYSVVGLRVNQPMRPDTIQRGATRKCVLIICHSFQGACQLRSELTVASAHSLKLDAFAAYATTISRNHSHPTHLVYVRYLPSSRCYSGCALIFSCLSFLNGNLCCAGFEIGHGTHLTKLEDTSRR